MPAGYRDKSRIPFFEDVELLCDKLARVRQIGQERHNPALVILADEMLAVIPRMRHRFKDSDYFRKIQGLRKTKVIPPGSKKRQENERKRNAT